MAFFAASRSAAAYLSAPAVIAASMAACAAFCSASGGFEQPTNTHTNARTITNDTVHLNPLIPITSLLNDYNGFHPKTDASIYLFQALSRWMFGGEATANRTDGCGHLRALQKIGGKKECAGATCDAERQVNEP